MSNIELKPCPFCGEDNSELEVGPEHRHWPAVRCNECGTLGPSTKVIPDEAAAAWNIRASSPAEGAEPITDVQKWKDKLFSCESALGEARDEIESLIGQLNFTEELSLSWSRDNENLRKQLENAKWPPKRDDIYRAIDTNVRSEPDKHFIDRRWLVGVNDAVDAILALTDEEQPTVIPGQL